MGSPVLFLILEKKISAFWFILQYFILFDIINGIIFLISFLNCLLGYRNTTYFVHFVSFNFAEFIYLLVVKSKIMASGPITSWQIDGETVETVDGFIFLGSKITADGDCSHEIKRRLLLGRKVMTNLESILKSRDVTLSTKVCLVKAIVFPVVMYGCESWTIKKAECRRMGAFELWCWRRLLRVPWTARRFTQSILKEISPGCSLEGLMLKLKLQYFGHMMRRADSLENTLNLGKTKGRRGRG